jgi:dTDP-4-amino-4,6-dideoxygalactose transaminase
MDTAHRPDRPQIGVGGFEISQRAKDLVAEVLDSGRITSGPMMANFEKEFSRLHDSRYALMTNSGTSCLQVALAALKEMHGWEDGDEVLVPAVTFVATSNVVMYNGLRPVFVDVDPDYFTIDPNLIEERITERTRAIMPVHLSGLPCDMDPIMKIASHHALRIIEDSAETMFARYKGRTVGSFGDIGCFSTYAAHIITTGVGGICTTSDPDLLVLLKSLVNHGRDSIYIRMDDDQKSDNVFEIANRRFSFIRLGHSFRATEMEAALGLAELEQHEQSIRRRQELARRLTEGLSDLDTMLQLPKIRPECDHTFMFYPIVIRDEGGNRDDIIRYLEENRIETRYLLPLINQPIYRQLFGNLDSEYPVAARLNERAFYIGCHPAISNSDNEYVIEQFHTFFEETG